MGLLRKFDLFVKLPRTKVLPRIPYGPRLWFFIPELRKISGRKIGRTLQIRSCLNNEGGNFTAKL